MDGTANDDEQANDEVAQWGISAHFKQLLANDELYRTVPLITSIAESDANIGRLVRVRCMVQDIFDPQYYLGLYRLKNRSTNQLRYDTGAFKNGNISMEPGEEFDQSFNDVTFERNMYYCVPVPCTNKWTNKLTLSTPKSTSVSTPPNKNKRPLEDYDNDDEVDMETQKKVEDSAVPSKHIKVAQQQQEEECMYEKDTDLKKIQNFPLPMDPNIVNQSPFVVMVYDVNSQNYLKMNEIVEFVGVVSKFSVPETHTTPSELDKLMPMMDIVDDQTATIPESIAPRLHAISYRVLDQYMYPTQTQLPFSNAQQQQRPPQPPQQELQQTRRELVQYIQQHLLGDQLAAEYLLCHLLSKVYLKTAGLILGNFPLNLLLPENLDNSLPEEINKLVASLVVRSHMLAVTVDNLNDGDLIPYKDYDKNRIVSGLLQLPKNTHLIVNETCLAEGQLYKQGVRNLSALKDIVLNQKVEYDFKYHPIEVDTDIQMLILSHGKSLTPGLCQVVMVPDQESMNDGLKVDEMMLDKFRTYLNSLMNWKLEASSETVTKMIEEDFVSTRQKDESTPQEIFHYWLTTARLLAISFGENQITTERWLFMKELERKRTNK
ncbi:hypothetical protein SAMD00019534_015000 [Acytostelium subglobosum LB1]|uniref:hypothetical protein n=1 Tax=Acytostelium subglobosum LB1 TaxID=1410327 RepID=UPI000644825B|nr:hypothetical protein SAMD00019534_015000 [Acytostelium subglobosum LB1]GAM18325.1 hypothetical protein SAMD00019534_015000 [Acytostelium subglobosum LB1]|eukprot:XP_012757545.1 hypothetical protein SAMD00019534_015000 [Acytostelium subglobosum LB1]